MNSTFLTTDPNSLDFKIDNSYFMPNLVISLLKFYQIIKRCNFDVFFAIGHGVHRVV